MVALLAAPASAQGTGAEPVTTVTDRRITESSGLVASPTHAGLVWTVNDSGGSAAVYGVSLSGGHTVAVLRLAGTQARDWEAMTAGRDARGRGLVWVGDVGDNRSVRESVVLRLVTEPTQVASQAVTPVSLRVRYPDGPHDVEAMLWTPDGRLLLVSKELFTAVVYQVPPAAVAAAVAGRSTSTPVTAQRLATVSQSLVTDGTALPDGRIVLRGYDSATVYDLPTTTGGGLAATAQLSLPAQQQGETMTAVDDGAAVLVGSEGERQPLWRVAVPRLLPASPAPPTTTSAASTGPAPPTGSSATAASPSPRRTAAEATGGLPSLGAAALAAAAVAGVGLLLATRRRDRRRGR